MQIKNLRPWAVEIAATGQVVEAGDVAEVDDDLGVSLCEQRDNWAAAPTPKQKPAVTGEED